MIIELFGPPGSGKTTFAHALARQLQTGGYRVEVALSYQPSDRVGILDFGIFLFISKITSAIFSTSKILLSSGGTTGLSLSLSMVKLIPPKSYLWRARIWQYIFQLSRYWGQVAESPDIVIFDQGYVQSIGSLATFNGCVDKAALVKALSLAPKADLTIRVVVPYGTVERRLRQRMEREAAGERIFEAGIDTNMRSFAVFGAIDDILVESGRKVISVEVPDGYSTLEGIRQVEQEIISALRPEGGRFVVGAEQRQEASPIAAADVGNRENSDAAGLPASTSQPIDEAAELISPQPGDVSRRLAQASAFALVVYICGAGLTSLAQLLIARLIGPRNYGIYSYVLAWTSILAYLATLGFNVSLLRFVPAYRASGDLDLARGVIKFALQRSLAIAASFGVIGAALVILFSDHSQRGFEISNLLGAVAVPLITAYALGATLVRAFGGVVSALLPERILSDGLLLLLVATADFLRLRAVDAPTVMLAVVISSAITVVLVFMMSAKLQPPGFSHVRPSYAPREWWSAIPPLMLITGLDVFVSRAGVMVLGWGNHIHEAGVFALALNVALLVGLSRIAVGTMFSPTAADFHARGERMALQNLFARATILSSVGALAVAIPLLVIVEPFLRFFGEGFVAGAPIARVLVLGYFFVGLCGPQQNLLTMTGNEWAAAKTMVAGAVANAIACVIGVALNGLMGAAVGVALALAVWNVGMAIYIYKRLKILPGLISALQLHRHNAERPDSTKGPASRIPKAIRSAWM
jgi:O-antigen/teichoic acid export membrane protein/thymidylate kinase